MTTIHDYYRDNVFTRQHQPGSALFCCGQLVTLSGDNADDIIAFAETLFRSGQHRRTAHAIQSCGLDKTDLRACYLAARATFEAAVAARERRRRRRCR